MNVLSSCVKFPIQIMFIRIDSHDIKEENLGKRDSTTQTEIPQDVDVITCYQAKASKIGAFMKSKIQVEANLQIRAKMKSEIQEKVILQFHSYRCLSRSPILYLCLNVLSIKTQSQLHPSRYLFGCPVGTNMKSKIQVQTTLLFHHCRTLLGCPVGTTMESKFASKIQTIH